MIELSAIFSPYRLFILVMMAVLTLPSVGNAQPKGAIEPENITVHVGPHLIRCDAVDVVDAKPLALMLAQGATVSVTWSFSIARQRSYWLNAHVGDVVVTRVVTSDLISRRWHLHDPIAGTDEVTDAVAIAVRFLTHIRNFPLIDRSLLAPGAHYTVTLTLDVNDNKQPPAWWRQWVDFGAQKQTGTFVLPQ
ncbi:MAG: DUF4390 domain-containing protein [Mariprofundales bacterium]|nr:DUF4390 domain-containing protein [Mariprofundales bacterium]